MATIDKINVNGTEYELTATDTKVTQSPVSTNANYELLLSNSANNNEETNKVGKSSGAIFNPSLKAVTFGNRLNNSVTGSYSSAEGYNVYASGSYAHAEGNTSGATGESSHAEGYNAQATGTRSHAEGESAVASGNYSSHAEGRNTTASGSYGSHAEGNGSTASADCAHAEGSYATASGNYSHAEGNYTTAQRKSQHVFGEYNVLDTTGTNGTVRGSYVEIVGNGTGSSARSNARTLDWSGNETLAGKLTVGAAPTADMDVATKKYVDDNIVDTKVTQTQTNSGDAFYELIFSGTADGSSYTEGVRKSSYAKYNPGKKAFTFGERNSNDNIGNYSVAEGSSTIASGYASHAEGTSTQANGDYSHAEGESTVAIGTNSHAEGYNTTAQRKNQHVFGRYNELDMQGADGTKEGEYVEIVGNGTSTIYSNARTLDWDGNEWLAGGLTLAGSSADITLTNSTWDGTKTKLKDVLPITGSNSNYSWIKFPSSKYAIIWGRKTATYTGRGSAQSITLNNYPFTLTNPVAQVTGNLAGVVDTQVLYVNTTGTNAEVYVRGSASNNVTATLYVTVCGTYS